MCSRLVVRMNLKQKKKKKKTYIIIINKVNVHYRRVKNEGFLVKRKKKKTVLRLVC